MTKVTYFRWTRSQRVQSNSVRSLRLQKRSPTLIGIALQANRAESLPFLLESRACCSRGRTFLLTCYIPASLHGSFFEPCFSLPPLPVLPSKRGRMEYSQVVRHRFLVPACKGSNPFTPDYEHPIGSVKNELTTTGEAADCSP